MINHLLLESKRDFQLHEEDTFSDIQLLVQIIKARLDVLFNGSSLIRQLLENFSNQGQGICNLRQSGRQKQDAWEN